MILGSEQYHLGILEVFHSPSLHWSLISFDYFQKVFDFFQFKCILNVNFY